MNIHRWQAIIVIAMICVTIISIAGLICVSSIYGKPAGPRADIECVKVGGLWTHDGSGGHCSALLRSISRSEGGAS